MKIKEKIKAVKGVLTLKVYKDGILTDTQTGENLVVDSGLNALAECMVGVPNKHIDTFLAGTDNTAPAPGNTALNSQEFSKVIDGANLSTTGNMVISFSMSALQGNGFTYNEWGLQCVDGTLFSHKTSTAIIKDTTIAIYGEWNITIY